MAEYSRKEPFFALCGLNCCLCPRFHTEGKSKCPGCGGPDFYEKHPSCSVISCNKKHDNVEYCFECSEYPCKKYREPSRLDSFISCKEVINNFNSAKIDLTGYLKELKMRYMYLCDLIKNYNDGKSKGFYCLALNIMPFSEIQKIMKYLESNLGLSKVNEKERAKIVVELFQKKADELGLELILRK